VSREIVKTSEGELASKWKSSSRVKRPWSMSSRSLDQSRAGEAGQLETQAREFNGVKVLSAKVTGMDRAQLRTLVDSLAQQVEVRRVVLATGEDSDVAIVAGVTKDLTSKVHAGKLAGAVAQAVAARAAGGRTWRKPAQGRRSSAGRARAGVYQRGRML